MRIGEIKQEPQESREYPADYLEVLSRFLRRAFVAPQDREELEILANGGDPRRDESNPDSKGVRQYYPGWTDYDFKRLLADYDDSVAESKIRPQGFIKVLNGFVVPRFMSPSDRKELEEMANGGNPKRDEAGPDAKSVREELYPEWKDDDFRKLLEEFDYAMEQLAKEDNK